MRQVGILLLLLLGGMMAASAQKNCKLAFDEIDPFDSLRSVGSQPVIFGHLMPSLYEEMDGPKLIPEGKAMFLYSENDSIRAFFLTLALPEYHYLKIDQNFNVKFKLADGEIIAFYNTPDPGDFDKTINMRVYLHTLLVPLDYFYKLASGSVELIRVEYDQLRRTIELSKEQQAALRQAAQCVGKTVGLYPIKP